MPLCSNKHNCTYVIASTYSDIESVGRSRWLVFVRFTLRCWIMNYSTTNKRLREWERLRRRKTIITLKIYLYEIYTRGRWMVRDKGRRDQWKVNLIVIPKTWKISFSFICYFAHCRHIGDKNKSSFSSKFDSLFARWILYFPSQIISQRRII